MPGHPENPVYSAWEYNVEPVSPKPHSPCPYGPHGNPMFPETKSFILDGIVWQFCMILQQVFFTWDFHMNVVAFLSSHGISHVENIFLVAVRMETHVNNIK